MDAVMGLTLIAPPATLSPDKMLNFNAIDRNRELLPDQPFPKTDGPAEPDWLSQHALPKIADQYAAVEQDWTSPVLGAGAAQTAVSLWAERFGWVQKKSNPPAPLPATAKGKSSMLVREKKVAKKLATVAKVAAAAPKNLIGSLDQFYLAAPLLSVDSKVLAW